MKQGFFITFEGGEGVGKSTQVNQLFHYLEAKKIPVIKTREPGGCLEAEHIRNFILDHKNSCQFEAMTEALIMLAARVEHVSKTIKPALDQGKIVLCDRYMDSTFVYQGIAGGVSLNILQQLQNIIIGQPRPNLTFLFDMEVEDSLQRVQKRGEKEDRFERKDSCFHKKLREGFLELAQKEPNRFVILDAKKNVQDLFLLIIQKMDSHSA